MELIQLPHKLTLDERSKLTVTGVTEVVSFDDTAVTLHTNLGTLEVQGQQLKLKSLSPEVGQVTVDGQISALFYEEPKEKRSFWRRANG
jgi:sporulation protein YabP